MGRLVAHLRIALRSLLRTPIFTVAVVVSLGLGIGMNTAIFSLLNALFLRSLPVDRPERLMSVYTISEQNPGFFASSYLNYLDYREHNQVFSGLAAYLPISLTYKGSGDPEQIAGEIVTGDYFDVLGVKAEIGRTFLPEEGKLSGGQFVAVLSHRFWERRFGADRGILNQTISLNGHPFVVVGVAAPGFNGLNALDSREVWVPIVAHDQVLSGATAALLEIRRGLLLSVVGRLKPGVEENQAAAALEKISTDLEREYPSDNEDRKAVMVPLEQSSINPNVRKTYLLAGVLLMAVVGLVLLISCANVANLLLVRALARRKEMAVRLSIGAARRDLVVQLLVESMLLAFLGGACGLVLARWSRDALWSLRPPELTGELNLSLDGRVLLFTLGLSLLTGLVFGLVPALQSTKVSLIPALKDQRGYGGSGPRQRLSLRSLLIVGQVALSLVALIGAGLFLRSLRHAQELDPGFNSKNLTMVSLNLGAGGYDDKRGLDFYRRVLSRVQTLPGVASAAISEDALLFGGGLLRTSFIQGSADPKGAEGVLMQNSSVSVDYFDTMGIRIVSGRKFGEQDRENTPYVVIVNETMAKHFWPTETAVGKRFKFNGLDDWFEVVGVASDCKYNTLGEVPQPYIYLPVEQFYPASATLYIRTARDPASLLPTLRREIQRLDPSLPLVNFWAVSDVMDRALWAPRMGATLLTVFSALALALAAFGLYGIIAYVVSQRRYEMAIRIALGADKPEVVRLVFREGISLVAVGMALGLALGLLIAQTVSDLLFGIEASDPVAYGATAVVLFVVASTAIYFPARKAARTDPQLVMRE